MSTQSTYPSTPPPPAPGSPNGFPPVSALRRSRRNRKVVGVAGGLGEWAGLDPLLIRVLFVVLTVFGGSGVLLYGLGWLLVPEEGQTESEGQRLFHGTNQPAKTSTRFLVAFVVIAGLIATGSFLRTGLGVGGLGLVAIIVLVVWVTRNGSRRALPPPGAPGWVPTGAAPEPGAYGQTTGTAYAAGPAPTTDHPSTYGPVAPPTADTTPLPTYSAPTYSAPTQQTYQQQHRPPVLTAPRERSILGRLTLSTLLVVVGLLITWNLATTHDVPAHIVLAAALAVVGVGLVVGAVRGRARGLVVLGLLLAVLASAAGVSDVDVRSGTGDRTWRPRTVSAVRTDYRLTAGNGLLDLSSLDPAALVAAGRTRIVVRQGAGVLQIVLPPTGVVVVDADVRAGSLLVPDRASVDGTGLRRHVVSPADSAAATAVLVIDVRLTLGDLEVRRAAA